MKRVLPSKRARLAGAQPSCLGAATHLMRKPEQLRRKEPVVAKGLRARSVLTASRHRENLSGEPFGDPAF